MNVILLGGLSLQGSAALIDLCRSEAVESIVCADITTSMPDKLKNFLDMDKIQMVSLDARDKGAVLKLL